jgi:ketose-bisphosphate aldolase
MALVPMRLMLDHAAENGYGIPAYNVNNMEQIQAIMQAANETDSPVILQASRGARSYAGEAFLRHLVLAAVETYPNIPIAMHQDHGNSAATCYSAMKQGFTSVMMDGSLEADAKTPASFEYNVDITRKVVEVAHAIGVSVEGELVLCLTTNSSQIPKKQSNLLKLLVSMPSRLRSVPATVLTNLLASLLVKSLPSAGSKKFTTACPTLTSSCTVRLRYPKIYSR